MFTDGTIEIEPFEFQRISLGAAESRMPTACGEHDFDFPYLLNYIQKLSQTFIEKILANPREFIHQIIPPTSSLTRDPV